MKLKNNLNNADGKAATGRNQSVQLQEEKKERRRNFFTSVQTPTVALKNQVHEHLTGVRDIQARAAHPQNLKL